MARKTAAESFAPHPAAQGEIKRPLSRAAFETNCGRLRPRLRQVLRLLANLRVARGTFEIPPASMERKHPLSVGDGRDDAGCR